MFNIFKRNKKKPENERPPLTDLDNNPLQEGDEVMSLRYDLGKCVIIREDDTIYYESVKTGEKVSWVKMIDASTENQKVKKIMDEELEENHQESSSGTATQDN